MLVASLAFLDPDLEDKIYADPDPKHLSVSKPHMSGSDTSYTAAVGIVFKCEVRCAEL
jgi:hypothetical protein